MRVVRCLLVRPASTGVGVSVPRPLPAFSRLVALVAPTLALDAPASGAPASDGLGRGSGLPRASGRTGPVGLFEDVELGVVEQRRRAGRGRPRGPRRGSLRWSLPTPCCALFVTGGHDGARPAAVGDDDGFASLGFGSTGLRLRTGTTRRRSALRRRRRRGTILRRGHPLARHDLPFCSGLRRPLAGRSLPRRSEPSCQSNSCWANSCPVDPLLASSRSRPSNRTVRVWAGRTARSTRRTSAASSRAACAGALGLAAERLVVPVERLGDVDLLGDAQHASGRCSRRRVRRGRRPGTRRRTPAGTASASVAPATWSG